MKPVKLEFSGLNSFSEKAVVDFRPLLQGGIFGIFGETGSGKSTILDAINFALYGDIERNPDKIDKINYKCDELKVNFTFDIFTEGSRKTYLVERSIKKKSGTHKAILYEYSDGKSVAVADNVKTVGDKITEIIGINKEDFRKCIALPQGEFAQFVNSAPAERIELIERLFNLQKYGKALKSKLSARENAAEAELNTLGGSLSVYESETKEKLKELEEASKQLEAELKNAEALSKTSAEEYATKKALFDKQSAYKEAEAKLAALEVKKPAFDELGKVLPVLSYCESAVTSAAEAEKFKARTAELEERKKLLAAECEKLKAGLSEAESAFEKCESDGEAEKLQRAESAMESLIPTARAYSQKLKEYNDCREKYKAEMKNGAAKQEEYKQICEKNNAEKAALEKQSAPDIDEYFKKELKGGILKDEYSRTLCYIKDLQSELRTFADNSPLYDFINGELTRKGNEYKELILSLKDAKLNVNEKLKQFQSALTEYRQAENSLTRTEGKLKACELELKNISVRADDIRLRGETLKKECTDAEQQLKEVFGGEASDFETKLKKAREATKAALEKRKNLSTKVEAARAALNRNTTSAAANDANLDSLAEQTEKALQSMRENVEKAGFDNVSKCRELTDKYRGYRQAHDEYNRFISDYSAAKGSVESLKPAEGAEEVTAEQVAAAKNRKEEAEQLFTRTSGELAVTGRSIQDLKKRLKEKAEVEKKLATAKKERDLIGQLKSLIRDNKFMEYIANEHLVNISRAASRTLIELTDGRYYLSYTDNNFCVGDNYNGGELRKVKTLSGGETFLVSLSLALALSATICRRSLKSIEFFFLDEGFGTLDGDLIDTVLGALEKLKNENFSIGLISHVEELKHRISSKILVSKATESHGSTIKISC